MCTMGQVCPLALTKAGPYLSVTTCECARTYYLVGSFIEERANSMMSTG